MSAPDLLPYALRVCLSDQAASTEEEKLFWGTQDWAGHRMQTAACMQRHNVRHMENFMALIEQFLKL